MTQATEQSAVRESAPFEYMVGTEIQLELPGETDELIPGVIGELHDDGSISALFPNGLPMISKQQATVCFRSLNHRFMRQAIEILDLDMEEENVQQTLRFEPSDAAQYGERRDAFRVRVASRAISVEVGEHRRGELQDVSGDGIGILVPGSIMDFAPGTMIKVSLNFDGQEIFGDLLIRHIRPTEEPAGHCLLGLSASDTWMKSQFTQIVMLAQRYMIKAGNAESLRLKSTRKADEAIDSAIAALDEEENEDRRGFSRSRFAFEGKAYYIEEGKLRMIPIKTTDFSRGGIGLVIDRYIYPKTEVLIEASNGLMRLQLTGHIRHCRHAEAKTHRAGISFSALKESSLSGVASHLSTIDMDQLEAVMAMSA